MEVLRVALQTELEFEIGSIIGIGGTSICFADADSNSLAIKIYYLNAANKLVANMAVVR